MKPILHRLSPLLTAAVTAAMMCAASGCIESDVIDAPPVERPLVETQLAEKIEALLPGTWACDQVEPAIGDLFVVFLGHDAVSGDVALLIEADNGEDLQAVSVSLGDNSATLVLQNQHWQIQTLGDEELALLNTVDGTILRFHRTY